MQACKILSNPSQHKKKNVGGGPDVTDGGRQHVATALMASTPDCATFTTKKSLNSSKNKKIENFLFDRGPDVTDGGERHHIMYHDGRNGGADDGLILAGHLPRKFSESKQKKKS
jgi:hypothetical protein